MAFVENILYPIIQIVAYIGLTVWIIYVFYWLFTIIFPNFRFLIKYKVFRMKHNEKMISFILEHHLNNKKDTDMIKKVLLMGGTKKEAYECCYVRKQLLKGGLLENE